MHELFPESDCSPADLLPAIEAGSVVYSHTDAEGVRWFQTAEGYCELIAEDGSSRWHKCSAIHGTPCGEVLIRAAGDEVDE